MKNNLKSFYRPASFLKAVFAVGTFLFINNVSLHLAHARPTRMISVPMNVPVGLTQPEVAKQFGDPLSTDVHETSRINIWYYKNGPIYFRDGKTIFVEPKKPEVNNQNIKTQTHAVIPDRKGKLSQADVDAILSAIPNDKPGGSPAANLPMGANADAADTSSN